MLRPTRLALRSSQSITRHLFWRRYVATKVTPQSRIERINSKLPKFLHRYTIPLSTAPISHITSFLLLHEITAILPLFALFATFHYSSLPLPESITESPAVTEGIEKYGKYFKRKGWLGETVVPEPGQVSGTEAGGGGSLDGDTWNVGADGMKILMEVGMAWAVVKVLLPVRLVGCVWLTPWFARVIVLPITRVVGKITAKSKALIAKEKNTLK